MRTAIVRTMIEKCLGMRKGEKLLIVTDDVLFSLAHDFYLTAKKTHPGIETVIMSMTARHIHGEEPPPAIRLAMQGSDAALLITQKSLSHTKARKEACVICKVRIASMPGVTREMFYRSIAIDYDALKKKVSSVIRIFERGRRVRITTEKGTDLTFSITGRKGFRDDGLYSGPGAFGNLPAGEAAVAPVEGTASGRLIVDGSAPFIGRLKRPAEILINNGYAKNMPFTTIKNMIRPLGRDAYNIAEFGIGLNPKAKVTGIILEDEKVQGTGHIAIGNNMSFGGRVNCPLHLDFVFFDPVVYVDGQRLDL
ncbi:MAG: aminopeptidase [Candidatus Omnitrophica bacterium]|nr:aminopeptidase [Candidatus Omnitrophota bacterium]